MPAHCERRSYCFRVSQKAWHCKQSDAGGSRDSLLTWIAVTCAPENVPHCQRLRELREFWRGIPVAGVHARLGEEIARRAARVNCSRSNYALSCIGRWVAYSVFRWSPRRNQLMHGARLWAISSGCGRERHYAVTDLRYGFGPISFRIAAARSSG